MRGKREKGRLSAENYKGESDIKSFQLSTNMNTIRALLTLLFTYFACVTGQRGFVAATTPSCAFFTGGTYGSGDRIPLPTSWPKPTHDFTPGTVNHGNGYYTKTYDNGKSVSYIHLPGQYGPATCASQGGCDSSLY